MQVIAILIALGAIVIIGLDLLLRAPKRREDRRAPSDMVGSGVDPASLRRRRPLAQRLSGAVLIAAAMVLYLAVHRSIGL